jgi:hypothetical protein
MFKVYLTRPTTTFIGMDALICESDIDFIKRELDGNVRLLTPSKVNRSRKNCYIYEDEHAMKKQLIADVEQGLKIAVGYSTAIDKMNGFLDGLNAPYLNITRYNKTAYNIEDFLQYSVVAFSPTMDAGVDVSFYDEQREQFAHFDRVYGLFNADNTTPKQAVQMLGRIRECDHFSVYIGSHFRGDTYNSEDEFKEHLFSRFSLLSRYGLAVNLNNEFEPDLANDFKYRLTYNSIKHRKESLPHNYGKNLKYFLTINQWIVHTVNPRVDDEIKETIRELEHDGVVKEVSEIARATVRTEEEINVYGSDLNLEMKREVIAFKVMNAFALDIDRPPVPDTAGLSFSETIDARSGYMERLQEHQYEKLYPYDENGVAVKFNYLAYYRKNSALYHRTRQIIDIYNNENVLFSFLLHKRAFTEVTHQIALILKTLGFTSLETIINDFDENRILGVPLLRKSLKKLHLDKFLLKNCGLAIVQHGNGYKLVSKLVSSNPREDCAFYLPRSPIQYYSGIPDSFVCIGDKVRCKICFKSVGRGYALRHVCRELPSGYEYILSEGKSRKRCVTCQILVDRNFKRHKETHES